MQKSTHLLLFLLLLPFFCYTQSEVSSGFIDSVVRASMERFPQAGVGIAVIRDGAVTHLKGYGTASLESGGAVDENTLFAIASNTKAFTTTALGILVDRGLLSWDDKVVDHIPEFRMYDPYVTAHFTIVDLLTHRSGLGLGAGDLMFFPPGADFTVGDVVKSFQYHESVSEFRTQYDYDNLLYIVAGEIIHRVSGKSWDRFVEENIMDKLGMDRSAALYQHVAAEPNVAMPHKTEGRTVVQVPTYTKKDGSVAAAGGIYASVKDMSKWVAMLLNKGAFGDGPGQRLISEKTHRELWKIRTLIFNDPYGDWVYNTHYSGYGLGFFIEDQNGYTIVSHTGGLPGMLSMVTLIPELNTGIVVLTNCDPGGWSFRTLSNMIKDRIIGVEGLNWLNWAGMRLERNTNRADSVVQAVWQQVKKAAPQTPDLDNYTGRYRDDWFGEVVVYEEDGRLWFKSLRSPLLRGEMRYYRANTFAVAMEYDAMDCDAFAMFRLDENGKATSIAMKGISPNIDFSFDYQDLDLQRISE